MTAVVLRGSPGTPRWPDPRATWQRSSRSGPFAGAGCLAPRASARRSGPSPAPRAPVGTSRLRAESHGTANAYERKHMNKAELVSAIAKRADVPASTVDSVLAGLQEELVDAITRGEKVAVSGLITVERTQRSARTGRNPQTGESIDIPAANTVKVTAGSNLKKAASSVPV
ncbi:HU family DNA-binding protein [Blastococcus saxobsidens]